MVVEPEVVEGKAFSRARREPSIVAPSAASPVDAHGCAVGRSDSHLDVAAAQDHAETRRYVRSENTVM